MPHGERKTKGPGPGCVQFDLDRTIRIRWLREAQRVDGISFTVHPVGNSNTVHPWFRPSGTIEGSHAILTFTTGIPAPNTP